MCQEFGESGPAKDGVVGAVERNDFEIDVFGSVIIVFAECYFENYFAQRCSGSSRHNAVELDVAWSKLASRNIHPLQRVEVDDVDACAAIHQHFPKLVICHDWSHH